MHRQLRERFHILSKLHKWLQLTKHIFPASCFLCKHLILKLRNCVLLCIEQENYKKIQSWEGYQAITQFHLSISEIEKNLKLVNR